MFTLVSRRAFLLAIPATFAVAGVATAVLFMRPVPYDLDLSMARVSESGLYRAELSPEALPITVGQMQTWEVTIRTADGGR